MRVGGDGSRDRRCGRAIAVVQSHLWWGCGDAVVVPWWGYAVLRYAAAITACLCEARMLYLFMSSGFMRGCDNYRRKLVQVVQYIDIWCVVVLNALVVYLIHRGCLVARSNEMYFVCIVDGYALCQGTLRYRVEMELGGAFEQITGMC